VIFWDRLARLDSTARYVSEVYGAGIESILTRARKQRLARGAVARRQTLRPRDPAAGGRRVIPPLLNAFIGLQKGHGPLVGTLGAVRSVSSIAESTRTRNLHFTAYPLRRRVVVA